MYRNLLGLLLTRGVLLGILVEVYRLVLQILPISDQKCNFSHPFSDQTSKIHIRFQTAQKPYPICVACVAGAWK